MKLKIPHSYSIIFSLIVIVACLTWILPSGEFDRRHDKSTNQTLLVPNTYHHVDSNPQGVQDVLKSILNGFISASEIIGFILIVGASYGVIIKTGAIDRSLHSVINKLGSKVKILIPILVFLFSIGGSIIGTFEETIPFYFIMVTIMISLGYDAILGVAVIILGTTTGNMASTINPFATGVASAIANIDLRDALNERIVFWMISTCLSTVYILCYAIRIKKTPEKSIVFDLQKEHYKHFINHDDENHPNKASQKQEPFSFSDKIIISSIFLLLGAMIYGIIELDWWMAEISALFIALAFITAIVKRMKENDFWDGFVSGAKDVLPATLVVGMAKAIVVVATNGSIIDSILNISANFLAGLPKPLFVVLDLVLEFFIAILVPSSSGHAALTMSIIPPLADIFELPKSVVISAYQISSGLSNMITPTSGVLMVALGIARIPWDKWAKFIIPLILLHFISAIIFLLYCTF